MFCQEISGLGIDMADVGLDSIIDNPTLKEIPIIKYIQSIAKITLSVRDAFEAKKQMVFLQQINNGAAVEKAIEKRRIAYQNGDSWFYREIENTIIYLSRHARIEKVKLQAKLYLDYINSIISEEKYYECLDVLDILLIGDIPVLKDIYTEQSSLSNLSDNLQQKIKDIKTDFDYITCGRLNAAGLVCPVSHGMSFGALLSHNYLITDLGKYFSKMILDLNITL